jgi:ferric-dicitrate binding protein FerR (iron transport regulator)
MNKLEPVILHYLQGVVSEEEMKELVAWINESGENKESLFRVKQIYDLHRGGLYPRSDEIEASWERLLAKMKQMETTPAGQPVAGNHGRKRYLSLLKYASVAVVFICMTLVMEKLMWKKDSPAREAQLIELDVASGPRMSHLTLPDGSKVVLNASTKFRFPDQFDAHAREVFLDGEAFFEVVHQAEKPFIVHTSHQKISVLGTTFNVMDYSADDYAITTLVSGSVEVQPSGAAPTASSRLKPDQQAFLNKTTSELIVENIKIDTARMWVNKIYHFRDEPLHRIARRLEKIYGVEIDITDNVLKEEKYTGVFRLELPVEEVLKIINYQNQFTCKVEEGRIVILPKKIR